MPLTANLSSVFYYDEESPSGLRWAINKYRGRNHCQMFICAGDVAGSFDSGEGYWRVAHCGLRLKCHRIVYSLHHGDMPDDLDVDHKDGNRANNRIENLRPATAIINARNVRKFKNNTSGTTGVTKTVCVNTRGKGRVSSYWVAECSSLDGAAHRKRFSINRFGDTEAYRLACEHRAKMIEELNAQGAGYTERHGT